MEQSNNTKKSNRKRVVVTGKRVKGVWTMESRLRGKTKRPSGERAILETENRRVRTLH